MPLRFRWNAKTVIKAATPGDHTTASAIRSPAFPSKTIPMANDADTAVNSSVSTTHAPIRSRAPPGAPPPPPLWAGECTRAPAVGQDGWDVVSEAEDGIGAGTAAHSMQHDGVLRS